MLFTHLLRVRDDFNIDVFVVIVFVIVFFFFVCLFFTPIYCLLLFYLLSVFEIFVLGVGSRQTKDLFDFLPIFFLSPPVFLFCNSVWMLL